MQSEKLSQFMLDLSKNPVKLDEFRRDPESIMSAYDLSAEEKNIVRSGNQDRVQQALDPGLLIAPVGATANC